MNRAGCALGARAVARCLAALLLSTALLVGCKAEASLSPTGTQQATSRPATNTVEPAPGAAPGAKRLVSRHTGTPPVVDGQVEALWETAERLTVPLTWGAEGAEHALDVELRALYDEQTLYLLAQWPGEAPAGAASLEKETTVYNQFTMHWRIPEPDAAHLDCNVACHTVFADGRGRVAYANAETIPVGRSETLQVAGGWQAGAWTLEWSRPLVSGNPFDLQLDNRDRAYAFMVKVFARIEGRPDPISKPHQLVFGP